MPVPKRPGVCEVCGAPFEAHSLKPRFCSRKCQAAGRKITDLKSHFWTKVDLTKGAGSCWLWLPKARANGGYGVLGFQGKTLRAHRVAWELTNGSIPEGLFVCHSCDNPPCCNPAHLFLGDQRANMQDMVSKGRHYLQTPGRDRTLPRGEAHPGSRLSEEQVREILRRAESGEAQRALAREYGVSQPTVQRVVQRKTWRHIK